MSNGIVKNNKTALILLFVMVILPISVSSISFVFLTSYEPILLGFTIWQWVLFYLITAITMSCALTPTTYIALVSGYFIGWMGLIGLVPSYLLASIFGFFIAKMLDKGKFLNYITSNNKVKGVLENLKTDEFWVIFFCRISPVLPFAMMNILLSFMNVRLKNFTLGSILGMLPRTILMVWIGTQANDILKMLKGKEDPDGSKLFFIALLLLSIVGLYTIFMNAVKKYNKAP